ncbi:hypothetical protein HF086_014463 [Spodoptera exigua]|uniref:Nanos-type domain-containing protein n=1 Tax=Spodoptera exigua TaxID=7107 RepID=A0A922MF07_SPOEX|nr:hypothetical protein HF086_014463 [Spodoptera exigua]
MYDCMSRQAVQECRFCKNNGERESYYRGHRLRDARGAVRVCMIVCRGRRCRSVGSARTTASASRTTAGTGCATRAARCESMYDCMSRQAVQECRFCKNNGERESYYRGHRLRDARGAGESMYDCMSRQAVQECRFCKNNGERESYYRGHRLRDARGAV